MQEWSLGSQRLCFSLVILVSGELHFESKEYKPGSDAGNLSQFLSLGAVTWSSFLIYLCFYLWFLLCVLKKLLYDWYLSFIDEFNYFLEQESPECVKFYQKVRFFLQFYWLIWRQHYYLLSVSGLENISGEDVVKLNALIINRRWTKHHI